VLGVGEASYYPAGTALLGDYFPRQTRGRAMAIWSAGSVCGIAAGFVGGGLLAEQFGWRSAFFVTAVPGLMFALLAFKLREPARGAAEEHGPQVRTAADATLQSFLRLLRIRTLRWAILSQTVLFFVLAANAYWLPTVLTRRFDMSIGAAGTLSGGVIVLGGLIGTLLGGWLADWRRRSSARADLEVGLFGFVAAAGTISVALIAPFELFVPMFFVTVVGLYLYNGPFTALNQNVVIPTLRASAVTLSLLISHLFGDSYAAAAVGALSDAVGSLQTALLITSPSLLLLAAGIAALGLGSIQSDMACMEADWANRLPGPPRRG
jgi:MFS family permease